MDKETELLKKRFIELANRSYKGNQFTFTNFLSLSDQSLFFDIVSDIPGIKYELYGGEGDRERVMIRFGNEEELGYAEAFPVVIVEIAPLMDKFADKLTHRDFLGALMNLGIEREVLGDIIVNEKHAYLFLHEKMKDFIIESLSFVKHTSVKLSVIEALPNLKETEKQEKTIQAASLRIDAVIAKVINESRSECALLFQQKKIFLNGRVIENNSKLLNEGDKITVRGYGRFEVKKLLGQSKKGKENVLILF